MIDCTMKNWKKDREGVGFCECKKPCFDLWSVWFFKNHLHTHQREHYQSYPIHRYESYFESNSITKGCLLLSLFLFLFLSFFLSFFLPFSPTTHLPPTHSTPEI